MNDIWPYLTQKILITTLRMSGIVLCLHRFKLSFFFQKLTSHASDLCNLCQVRKSRPRGEGILLITQTGVVSLSQKVPE